ncbi:MAG TPA: carbon-nitrogen hydrolase family protein [Candidatus Limnocylindria bacterium]|nr:carbon-nitrogen hydrolase family protein [Candidatus Limnocylindria bacterium]
MTNAAVTRADGRLRVALISDTFWEADGEARLRDTLAEAAERGADLAVLPELPLNEWTPATQERREDDAEPMDGPRATAQANAAREAKIGVIGGIIHADQATGRRTSRALVIDASGEVRATYEKLHLPEEPGFWETSHYDPGTEPPQAFDAFGVPIGLQLCSDTNRPEGTHLLAAQGAMAVLIPRATEEATYQRWKLVFRANALTSCCWVLSVNRPRPEGGALIGGPSIVVDPRGDVVLETTDRIALATIDAAAVTEARKRYPGYLPVRADLYARGWSEVAGRDG